MADIQSFTLTPTGKKNVPNCPTFTISAQVFDNSGALIADLTGQNSLDFPAVLAGLTEAQIGVLENLVGMWFVRLSAGLTDPLTGF